MHTAKQIEVKQKFREAVVCAKGVISNPDLAASYLVSAKPGTSVYNLALADYAKPKKSPRLEILNASAAL
ncbi:hypothetical protein [Pedobacter ureilyticus]|uniref:Uncharacterized protein n=1 Tax=Pedobacter ureilyticus TaxID=1393051 RepID=A0ABW9JBH2_9SPHI|nr:hypothetical protein [Pedobacter helvus]